MDRGERARREQQIAHVRQTADESRADANDGRLGKCDREVALQIADRLDGEADVLEASLAE